MHAHPTRRQAIAGAVRSRHRACDDIGVAPRTQGEPGPKAVAERSHFGDLDVPKCITSTATLRMTGRRARMPTLLPLWRKARRESNAASRLPEFTTLRLALHGWQRWRAIASAEGHMQAHPKRRPAIVGVLRSRRRAKRWCGEAARTQGGPGTNGLS